MSAVTNDRYDDRYEEVLAPNDDSKGRSNRVPINSVPTYSMLAEVFDYLTIDVNLVMYYLTMDGNLAMSYSVPILLKSLPMSVVNVCT